jgi:hypothetical protein
LGFTLESFARTVLAERPIRRIQVTAPSRAGRYVLNVRVGKHRAQALVVVRAGR